MQAVGVSKSGEEPSVHIAVYNETNQHKGLMPSEDAHKGLMPSVQKGLWWLIGATKLEFSAQLRIVANQNTIIKWRNIAKSGGS